MTELRGPDQGDPIGMHPELAPRVEPDGMVPVDHQLPVASGPSHGPSADGATDPEAARLEILRTRSRMSDTIDQIEDQLLRRKERLQAQLDLKGQLRERLAPAREGVESNPLAVFGGVLLAGAAIGYLTRGRDEPSLAADELEQGGRRTEWRRRARRWESRSRELMRLNAELEAEVRRLRADLDDEPEAEGGWLRGLGEAVGTWIGRGRTRSETVVELEADDLPGDYHPSVSYAQVAHGQRMREPDDPLQG